MTFMKATEDTMENAIIKAWWAMDNILPSGLVVVIMTSQHGGKKKDMFVLKRQLTNSMDISYNRGNSMYYCANK